MRGALLHAQCLTACSCGQGTNSWQQQQVMAGSHVHRDCGLWGVAANSLRLRHACLSLPHKQTVEER